MDLGLKGRRVLITGATKGIGRQCAEIFADEGADVAICARDAAGVTDTIEVLKAKGVTTADKHALKAWVNDSAATLGGIDMVVANVSALAVGGDEAAWETGFAVDMMHSVQLVNAAMARLDVGQP